mgnify:CR=1 FL=1
MILLFIIESNTLLVHPHYTYCHINSCKRHYPNNFHNHNTMNRCILGNPDNNQLHYPMVVFHKYLVKLTH